MIGQPTATAPDGTSVAARARPTLTQLIMPSKGEISRARRRAQGKAIVIAGLASAAYWGLVIASTVLLVRLICAAMLIGGRARSALLEVQLMQAPHIAEADDEAMTRLEGQMTAAALVASNAVDELGRTLSPAALPQLDAARAALSRFLAIHGEIITLSRRNSNVRSLALSLGRKRMLTAACEEQLQAFDTALSQHAFTATR